MQYIFTAVFTKDEDNSLLVSFPDLPGCCAQGINMIDAVKKAESVLGLCLFDMEQQGIEIPKSRYPDQIDLLPGEVTSIILAETSEYHARYANKTVEHTLTMPVWLGQIAESSNFDLSAVLQDAVKREIGMPVHSRNQQKDTKPSVALPPLEPAVAAFSPAPKPEENSQQFDEPLVDTQDEELTDEPVASQEDEPFDEPMVRPMEDELPHDEPVTQEEETLAVPVQAVQHKPAKKDKQPKKAAGEKQTLWQKLTKSQNTERRSKSISPFFLVSLAVLLPLLIVAGCFAFVARQTDWLDDTSIGRFFAPREDTTDAAAELDYFMQIGAMQRDTESQQQDLPTQEDLQENQPQDEQEDLPVQYEPTSQPNPEIQALAALYGSNDVVGRIVVSGTQIDYPVVQGSDNEFYRTHNIAHESSSYGAIFLDHMADLADNNLPINNIVLFGRMVPDGSMMYEVARFADYEFFSNHSGIYFTSHYNSDRYEVFSFYTDNGEQAFSPGIYRNWEAWVQNFATRSHHPVVAVDASDRIITLVAESTTGDTLRYIIHARLVR